MKAKPFGRVAAGIGAIVLAGVVAGTAQSASAATGTSVRKALTQAPRIGSFPSIAVVRGTNNSVYATTGSGFTNLGGRTFYDPAVAAAPNQIYFLAKGTNNLLYIRDEDSGWREVLSSPPIGTSLTAAYNSGGAGSLFVSFLDGGNRVIRLRLGNINATNPTITSLTVGPTSYGAAVNSNGQPLFVSDAYTPGLLGVGTLRQWNGTTFTPPVPTTAKRYLNCARERLGTAFAILDSPVGVAVCKSGTGDSVHFLGNHGPFFLGYGTGQDLGGHIIGSPGIALQSTLNLSSVVYVTGTNHHVYAATVLDLGGVFTHSGWTDLGGVAVGGVQASSWTL